MLLFFSTFDVFLLLWLHYRYTVYKHTYHMYHFFFKKMKKKTVKWNKMFKRVITKLNYFP